MRDGRTENSNLCTSVLRVELPLELLHLGIYLLLPVPVARLPQRHRAAQGAELVDRLDVLRVRAVVLVPHHGVLVVVGDADLGADDDHEVGDVLAVVDHDGLDGPVEHADLEEAHLAAVLKGILKTIIFLFVILKDFLCVYRTQKFSG